MGDQRCDLGWGGWHSCSESPAAGRKGLKSEAPVPQSWGNWKGGSLFLPPKPPTARAAMPKAFLTPHQGLASCKSCFMPACSGGYTCKREGSERPALGFMGHVLDDTEEAVRLCFRVSGRESKCTVCAKAQLARGVPWSLQQQVLRQSRCSQLEQGPAAVL